MEEIIEALKRENRMLEKLIEILKRVENDNQ